MNSEQYQEWLNDCDAANNQEIEPVEGTLKAVDNIECLTLGWQYASRVEMVEACDLAKAKEIRDARKHCERGTLYSYPNPYLLAMDENGRMNNEPWFFDRYPSRRDVIGCLERHPTAHFIAAYYDLHVGDFEMRMAGETDEPSDWTAEIILYRVK